MELAKEARDEAEAETGRHGFVAASVGPYGATLCDRSEYTGAYVDQMSKNALMKWHKSRLEHLKYSGADIIAFETIPALEEALACVQCLKDMDLKGWLTFTLKDAKTTVYGDDVKVAMEAIVQCPGIVAVGVNCFSMALVDGFLQYVKDMSFQGRPLIIKPNAEISEHDRGLFTEFKVHERVRDWVAEGACWIGGCCSTDCSDIAQIRKELERDNHILFLQKGERLWPDEFS